MYRCINSGVSQDSKAGVSNLLSGGPQSQSGEGRGTEGAANLKQGR